jgi:hypothetical protein
MILKETHQKKSFFCFLEFWLLSLSLIECNCKLFIEKKSKMRIEKNVNSKWKDKRNFIEKYENK